VYELYWRDFIDLIHAVTEEAPSSSSGGLGVDVDEVLSELRRMDSEALKAVNK